MGQKSSQLSNKAGRSLPLQWILRGQKTTLHPNPEQPIKFQYKTKRKITEKEQLTVSSSSSSNNNNSRSVRTRTNNLSVQTLNNFNKSALNNTKVNNCSETTQCKIIIKTENVPPPTRAKSEPNLMAEKREKHRHRRKSSRSRRDSKILPQFGYEIQDIDEFLNKATMEKPANIPVVLAFPSVLYQTRTGGYQAEIALPLGMVVNAVFKNQHWLYVQTPHAEEGYVSYAACLPLGIIPPPDDTPEGCWEISTDVFPKPSGNMTDTEKLSSKSDCSTSRCNSRRPRNAASTCGEKSVDRLYLRAAASAKNKGVRQTLLVISSDYESAGENTINVTKGDVVALLSTHLFGWFWVRNKNGSEGFIPSAVAGHGFL